MKHTKGNWEICTQTETQIFIASTTPGARTEEGKGGYICQIKQEREHNGLTEQDEANAKLICAAPSMLETLQEVHKRLRAFERDLDNRQDATREADRERLIDIDLGVIAAINAATESTMHHVFAEALNPFGIK